MIIADVLEDAFLKMEAWLTENVALECARAEGAAFVAAPLDEGKP